MTPNHVFIRSLVIVLLSTTFFGCSPTKNTAVVTQSTVKGTPVETTSSTQAVGEPKQKETLEKVLQETEAKKPAVKEQTKAEKAMAAADKLRHQNLDSTLWVQTSGEYAAITRQTYRLAAHGVKEALMDPEWTASLEQQEMADAGEINLAELPPCVVLDVDETCLDNSRFQVSMIEGKKQYSRDGWKAFVKTKNSFAIPGAVDFLTRCRAAGVQVIFVTNREHEVEPETRKNMIKEGLVLETDDDIIYTKLEKKDWKSDKINRRKFLAKKYRILMLCGDDLHDFADTTYHPTSEYRREFVGANASYWGTRWIVLPNPNYGGWEQSLYDWDYKKTEAEKLEAKRGRLKH